MTSTINKEEIQKFSKLADEWWDVNGKFKPLHMFNPVRIEYILDITTSHFKIDKSKKLPLNNLKILDIGCGGGLISEPMTRLGSKITAIDASSKNISIAKAHAKKSNLNITYLNNVPEDLNAQDKFDVILNLEVVEHVENLDLYLKSCFKLLKPKGIMFTATLNRTLTAYIKAIVGAEYVLRWLPIGTHDWNKFIRPEELERKLTDLNFSIKELTGLSFNPFFKEWKRTKDLSVNYILVAQKN
jgi:2-polyprenyl-6-hydroxyphenyl methylase/3-demethylubiquinone-9 3-methyltransferase